MRELTFFKDIGCRAPYGQVYVGPGAVTCIVYTMCFIINGFAAYSVSSVSLLSGLMFLFALCHAPVFELKPNTASAVF
jgi:hypothetical protein